MEDDEAVEGEEPFVPGGVSVACPDGPEDQKSYIVVATITTLNITSRLIPVVLPQDLVLLI